MEHVQGKTISNILFSVEKQSHNGFRLIFQFEKDYLFFDSVKFILGTDGNILKKYPWKRITWYDLHEEPSITRIREDELTSYFLEFSNGDIFFISQEIDGMEFWYQDFKIVSKDDQERYNEVLTYMNEDFVEDGAVTLESISSTPGWLSRIKSLKW